ncbi:Cation transport protein [Jannaschia seohaensis]|uniref:Cation transport protein n=1 Tax=Jannaschia seohaensis TaxID=475081 RepID=A0A2Y9AE84_9RHOB|nr:cation transport protein [Jannaschia seohaensis]SSA41598.1 Cation transport protein [Jannaschia seohaensis]
MGLLLIATFLLLLSDPGLPFEAVMFEAVSAMGTVGLSMGITGELTGLGKLIVIVLMTAGRVGILTFGMALASHDESRAEEADNDLVLSGQTRPARFVPSGRATDSEVDRAVGWASPCPPRRAIPRGRWA